MRRKFFVPLLCSLLFGLAGCDKSATSQPSSDSQAKTSLPSSLGTAQVQPQFDACALIAKEEIQAIQESPVIDTKSSESSDGAFRVSQCYYAATESNKSVSVAVTQSSGAGKRSPKDFWQETFGRYTGEEKEREGDKGKRESLGEQERGKEEERESTPPKKIDGIGDAAYWSGNRAGGALYVLRKDVFIRISVGGPDNEETKINKSKALAEKALSRL
jgi:hypothetical protein